MIGITKPPLLLKRNFIKILIGIFLLLFFIQWLQCFSFMSTEYLDESYFSIPRHISSKNHEVKCLYLFQNYLLSSLFLIFEISSNRGHLWCFQCSVYNCIFLSCDSQFNIRFKIFYACQLKYRLHQFHRTIRARTNQDLHHLHLPCAEKISRCWMFKCPTF